YRAAVAGTVDEPDPRIPHMADREPLDRDEFLARHENPVALGEQLDLMRRGWLVVAGMQVQRVRLVVVKIGGALFLHELDRRIRFAPEFGDILEEPIAGLRTVHLDHADDRLALDRRLVRSFAVGGEA